MPFGHPSVKTFIQACGFTHSRGGRVDFYFSLQPHGLSLTTAGQWEHFTGGLLQSNWTSAGACVVGRRFLGKSEKATIMSSF